jgi:sulfur-carrier protein
MKVRVQLFALTKALAGASILEIEMPGEPTVGQLRRELASQVPALEPLAPHLMFAIDADYANDAVRIPANAEVACIPPVSGG